MTERDYSKGVIYKIKCLDKSIKDIYVGSTINIIKRKSYHKFNCTNTKGKAHNYCVYQFIRAHGDWDNWILVPIKKHPCNSKLELEIEEENVRVELEEFSTLNRNRAWAGVEYGLPTKEYKKKYAETHRKEILEKQEKYRETHKEEKYTCECGSTLRKGSKAKHKITKKHEKYLESK